MMSWWKGAHPGAGDLRAFLDGELPLARRSRVASHVEGCPACRGALAHLQTESGRIAAAVQALHAQVAAAAPPRLPLKTPNRWVPYLSAAAVAALMVVVVAVPPVRAVAAQWLSIFRAEQIAVVRIDPQAWSGPGQGARLTPEQARQLAQVTGPAELPQPVPVTPAEAQALGGGMHQPDLPAGLAGQPDHLMGVRPAEIRIKPDVDTINAWLAGQGIPARLSPKLKGQTIQVTTPAAVIRVWGEPQGKPFVVVEATSPQITGTAAVDLGAMAEIIAQLAGAPADVIQQLRAIPDLGRTLVVPVARGMGETVQVNGAPGVYYGEPGGRGGSLVWVRGGRVFVVAGPYSRQELLKAVTW